MAADRLRRAGVRPIPAEQILDRIRAENPWWASPHQVPEPVSAWRPRAYLDLFLPLVQERTVRRAVLLMGPRRVGKTVLIQHAIQRLLESGTDPHAICYLAVDHPLYTGLGHYLESIRRLYPLAGAIRVTLGGHGKPIDDLEGRLAALEAFHRDRLELVLHLLGEPVTMAELSDRLFPAASGYHALLALEETGAHVEYLLQRGAIGCVNPEALESDSDEPLRYIRRGPLGLPIAERPPGTAATTDSAQPPTHGTSREERSYVRL